MSTTRHSPERSTDGVDDQATAEGTNAQGGTPQPSTGLNTGRDAPQVAGSSMPDPDYGIDPRIASPNYGGTGRGRESAVDMTHRHRSGLEGVAAGGDDPAPGDATGMGRGGDTTSGAGSHSDTSHGMGEAGARPDGRWREPSQRGTRCVRSIGSMVDPNDTSTFGEGVQNSEGPRA